jgi:hypothetical protein
MITLLTAILRELRQIRLVLLSRRGIEIDLSSIEETDEERRMRILMAAL